MKHDATASEAHFGPLPYGSRFTRLLPFLHRAFLWANRYCTVPVFRAGLGSLMVNPLTGCVMVLRTRGRKSGEWRDAPLGYAILDGSVHCVAGWSIAANPWTASDEVLREKGAGLPVVRIRPTGIAAGPADPGGWRWVLAAVVGGWWLARRAGRRRG